MICDRCGGEQGTLHGTPAHGFVHWGCEHLNIIEFLCGLSAHGLTLVLGALHEETQRRIRHEHPEAR